VILERGTKLLISHRRLFAEDQPRFFVGVVEVCEGGVARVSGHSWVREQLRGDILRKQDRRTKLVALASGSLFIYVLPEDLDIEALRIEHGKDRDHVLTDGKAFRMDISERRQSGI
jgi:hypothetical protein